MDQHIKKLFDDIPPFYESALMCHPDFERYSLAAQELEAQIRERLGEEAAHLMDEYLAAYFETEWFECFHYFCHGYEAAKAEEKP